MKNIQCGRYSLDMFFDVRIQDCSFPIFLPNHEEDYIQKTIVDTGRPYEERVILEIARIISEFDGIIIDAGSHVGNHTFALHSITGRKVWSFEPNSELCAAQQRTVENNSWESQIKIFNTALGERGSSYSYIEGPSDNLGMGKVEFGSGNHQVDYLDQIVPETQEVAVIKIDVEGSEHEVLSGSLVTIQKFKPLIVVEAERPEDFVRILALLRDQGYQWVTAYASTLTHLFVHREKLEQTGMEIYRPWEAVFEKHLSLKAAQSKYRSSSLQSLVEISEVTLSQIQNLQSQFDRNTIFLHDLSVSAKIDRAGKYLSTYKETSDKVTGYSSDSIFHAFWLNRLLKNWTVKADKRTQQKLVLFANRYPDGEKYGGESLKTRVALYRELGFAVIVITPPDELSQSSFFEKDGVLKTKVKNFPKMIPQLSKRNCKFLFHAPSPETQQLIFDLRVEKQSTVWFHGAEARSVHMLSSNWSRQQRESVRDRVEKVDEVRLEMSGKTIENPEIKKVYVSEFIKNVAESDTDSVSTNARVIPNVIDTRFFHYLPKSSKMNKRLLLIRPFTEHNYAPDIVMDAILDLSNIDGFSSLEFTICGFGKNYAALTKPISKFPNVNLLEGYLSKNKIRDLHSNHGIFMAPTRHDSQGVSACEAASSGLAVITHAEGGVVEYFDRDSAVLVNSKTPSDFAKAIWKLAHDNEHFQKISKAGAFGIRQKCGPQATVYQELNFVTGQEQ